MPMVMLLTRMTKMTRMMIMLLTGMANGQRDIDRQLAKHDSRSEHSSLMVILMEIQGKRIARVDDLIFLIGFFKKSQNTINPTTSIPNSSALLVTKTAQDRKNSSKTIF